VHALTALGFPGATNVHLGKAIALDLESASEGEAIARARAMCERLLANPVTEDFTVDLAGRLGAGIGGGIPLDGEAAISVAALAQRPLAGPLSLAARAGWTHRRIDAATVELGVGVQLAATPSLVLTAGGALRGEVRVQDHLAMEDVARVGVGGAASLDLAILSIPLAIGLRIEPAFTELAPGTRAHAALLELGYDWR